MLSKMRKSMGIFLVGVSVLAQSLTVGAVEVKDKVAKETIQWCIQPQFEEAQSFSEGLAAVKKDGKWGFINKKGEFIIKPQYEYVESFQEGLAMVVDSKTIGWGYIDQTGKVVLQPDYEYGSSFKDGVATVGIMAIANDKTAIDKEGKAILPKPSYMDEKSGLQGITAFNEGLAGVSKYSYVGNEDKYTIGVIDKKGKWILKDLPYHDISEYKEGLFVVTTDLCNETNEVIGRKVGAIDKTGKLMIPQDYYAIWGFQEGLSAVRIGGEGEDYKIGYIDHNNKMIIELKFKWVSSFSEGTAVVATEVEGEIPKKVGVIDKTGNYVITPQLEDARAAKGGMLAVKKDGKWGYIKSPVEMGSLRMYIHDDTKKDQKGPEIFDTNQLPEGTTFVSIRADHKEGYRFKKLAINGYDMTTSIIEGGYGMVGTTMIKGAEVEFEAEPIPYTLETLQTVKVYNQKGEEQIGDTLNAGERYTIRVFGEKGELIGFEVEKQYAKNKEMRGAENEGVWGNYYNIIPPKNREGSYARIKIKPMKGYSQGEAIYSKVYKIIGQ
ncbi:MAG: WG repeat-containing protein [Cellulosilyticaceae bacterium]